MTSAIQAGSDSQIFGLKMYFSYNWAKSRYVEGQVLGMLKFIQVW